MRRCAEAGFVPGMIFYFHRWIPPSDRARCFAVFLMGPVLGSIVGGPLAGALIMRRLGVPRRQISIVEGEGLFNDATALVCFRVAVAAVVMVSG